MGSKIDHGVDVAEVRTRFEQWSSGRSRKARIPDELWADAIEMARQEGVNRTAQELHLDGGKLKRLMVATDSGASEVPRQPRFLELFGQRALRSRYWVAPPQRPSVSPGFSVFVSSSACGD